MACRKTDIGGKRREGMLLSLHVEIGRSWMVPASKGVSVCVGLRGDVCDTDRDTRLHAWTLGVTNQSVLCVDVSTSFGVRGHCMVVVVVVVMVVVFGGGDSGSGGGGDD
jgi:hypothetical protein